MFFVCNLLKGLQALGESQNTENESQKLEIVVPSQGESEDFIMPLQEVIQKMAVGLNPTDLHLTGRVQRVLCQNTASQR